MPGMKMHHVFGAKLLLDGAFDLDESFISEYPHSFYMGLQGPDLFFYSASAYIFYRQNIGSTMHNENVMALFEALLRTRNEICNTEEGRKIADAYIAGFMGHYTLDTTCHPYVYCRTQHLRHEGKAAYDFGMHVALETDMDNAYLTHYLGVDPFDYNMAENLTISESERKVIAGLLTKAIAKTFPKKRISYPQTYRSLLQIKLSAKLLLDPYGWKKKLVRGLEEIALGYPVISTMVSSKGVTNYPDPCNEKHKTWYNPWDVSHTLRTESLFDLTITARETLLKRIRMYTDITTADATVPLEESTKKTLDLLSELGDCSYTTGFPI